jgi:hypothetical protein
MGYDPIKEGSPASVCVMIQSKKVLPLLSVSAVIAKEEELCWRFIVIAVELVKLTKDKDEDDEEDVIDDAEEMANEDTEANTTKKCIEYMSVRCQTLP